MARLISHSVTTNVGPSMAGPFVLARRGLPLYAGNVIQTDLGGRAEASFRDGRIAQLNANTVLEISATRFDRIRLIRGNVRVIVPLGGPMDIDCPAASCHVPHTDLHLSVEEDGTTTLTVLEGDVDFRNAQGSVVVRDGQQSTARRGQAPTPPVAAVNLPNIIQWTNDVQPVALLLETSFVSQDPATLNAATREAEALPAGPMRWRRLGDVRHDQGALQPALDAYQAARDGLAPQTPGAERAVLEARIGQTWLELGNVAAAEEALRHSLELDPSLTAARVGLVMTLLSRRANTAALAEARTAVDRDSDSAVARTALALALIRLGERDATKRDEARQELDRAITRDVAYAPAYAWQSFLLRAAERLDEAEKAARRAKELAPNSSLARQSLSDIEFARGRIRAARAEAEEAVRLNSLSPGAHVSLGRALLQAGEVRRAVSEAYQAVALDPDLDRAHFFLGLVLWERRQVARAEREFKRAIELNPGYLEAQAYLARVYVAQGRRDAARAVAQQARQQDADFAPVRAALGRVQYSAGQLSEAAAEYQSALALAPGSPLYHLELARVYLDQNDLPNALAQGLAAVNTAPSSSEAHAVLGLIYDRQENRAQAEREYREAISFSAENALAHLGLVTAFSPFSFQVIGSGRLAENERVQALLRDPAVLEQLFQPGLTSELAVEGGQNGEEEQHYRRRGQFARGRVHDLSRVERGSNDGYRANGWSDFRFLESDVAVQATARTQVLLQYLNAKDGSGLPGPVSQRDLDAHDSGRQEEYHLSVRQEVGPKTQLWLQHGVGAVRVSRKDPDAGLPDGLGQIEKMQRRDERITELRLDHQSGRHHLTYGVARLRDTLQVNLKFAFPASDGMSNESRPTALEVAFRELPRYFAQYLQDDYHIGHRGSLIVGAQLLHSSNKMRNAVPFISPELGEVDLPPPSTERHDDLLPYVALTYGLDARNLVRLIGHKARVQFLAPLLAPPEAFIVGEEVSTFFDGLVETYELDYERRFSMRTFGKLFLQHSRARPLSISASLDQAFETVGLNIPRGREQIVGLRIEQQINRYLSGFSRLTYAKVDDRSRTTYDFQGGLDDPDHLGRHPSRGLQAPFSPRWRGLFGLNYVDRTGTKLLLLANFASRQYIDVERDSADRFGSPTFDRSKKRRSIGARTTFDLRIAKEPSLRWEYALSVTNLFNTATLDWPGFPRPGRAWRVAVARRF